MMVDMVMSVNLAEEGGDLLLSLEPPEDAVLLAKDELGGVVFAGGEVGVRIVPRLVVVIAHVQRGQLRVLDP